MKPFYSLLAFATACLATSLPAQVFTLRGELDEGRSTGCYYCPNIPFTIKFSETPVRSSTVNLKYYKNLSAQLLMTGTWNATSTPPGFEVKTVTIVNDTHDVSNKARTGSPLRFTVLGPANSMAGTFIALGNGFLPLFGRTAMLLDPATMISIGSANLGFSGQWRFNIAIPANPNLVGFRFWSQSVILPPNAAIYSTNPMVTVIER